MKTYRVGFAPAALGQIECVQSWWHANRLANPELFGDELRAVVDRLATAPS